MRNKTILIMIALITAIAAPVVARAQSQEQEQVQPEQEQVQPEPKPPVATAQPRPSDPCIATCAAQGKTPGMTDYPACLRKCHKDSMPGREHSSAMPPSLDQLLEGRDPATVFEGGGSMG
jgi:hypothetical protein